jgi:hypothetical protein
MLNASAGGFFVMLEATMWEDLILHVCQLTDQPTNEGRGRRERLSILRLTAGVDPAIHDRVRGLVSKAIKTTKFARAARDRHIAHRDLRLALKQRAQPLKAASRKDMGQAIDAIGAVLNAVETHYRGSETAYEHSVAAPGDAEALLHVLREGLEAMDEEMRLMQAGQIPPGGFKPKRPI